MPERHPPLAALSKATGIGPQPHTVTLGETLDAPDPFRLLLERFVQQLTDDPVSAAMAALPMLMGEPMFKSLGKPVSDMSGATFTPPRGSGLPSRLRLTNYDAPSNNVEFHGVSSGQPFRATPGQVDTLVNKGGLDLEQPPAKAVAATRKKIAAKLDQPKSK